MYYLLNQLNLRPNLFEFGLEFLRLFGFGIEGVDYEADVCTDVQIPNVINI